MHQQQGSKQEEGQACGFSQLQNQPGNCLLGLRLQLQNRGGACCLGDTVSTQQIKSTYCSRGMLGGKLGQNQLYGYRKVGSKLQTATGREESEGRRACGSGQHPIPECVISTESV